MEIYRLTDRGERLSHSYRAEKKPEWGVIFFLKKRHLATKEQILENVDGATSLTLAKLSNKRIISEESGVSV